MKWLNKKTLLFSACLSPLVLSSVALSCTKTTQSSQDNTKESALVVNTNKQLKEKLNELKTKFLDFSVYQSQNKNANTYGVTYALEYFWGTNINGSTTAKESLHGLYQQLNANLNDQEKSQISLFNKTIFNNLLSVYKHNIEILKDWNYDSLKDFSDLIYTDKPVFNEQWQEQINKLNADLDKLVFNLQEYNKEKSEFNEEEHDHDHDHEHEDNNIISDEKGHQHALFNIFGDFYNVNNLFAKNFQNAYETTLKVFETFENKDQKIEILQNIFKYFNTYNSEYNAKIEMLIVEELNPLLKQIKDLIQTIKKDKNIN
ncbi:hypothetical protein V2E24_02265 [Mycoplasmopsis ciconiae]|uniref:Lipoprotein n=1 Tax=Mycoplasmopsis ciconiae TaxID=561067 RepID=A0ABU7MMI6_9BACT|nr:hypothetical protein [Mycoplasmopsis ciconiae]